MEGDFEHDGHRTWYRVFGDLEPGSAAAPVIVCHGGPGASHDWLENVPGLLPCGSPRGDDDRPGT